MKLKLFPRTKIEVDLAVGEPPKKSFKWLIILLVAFFVLVAFLAGGVLAFEWQYQNQIYPGVQAGKINLGGLSAKEALSLITDLSGKIENNGLKIMYQEDGQTTVKVVSATSALSDPDLSQRIISFDNQATARAALAVGRGKNLFLNLAEQFKALTVGQKIKAKVDLNEAVLEQALRQQFVGVEKPSQNARPEVTWQNGELQIKILPESAGVSFDYAKAIEQIRENLMALNNPSFFINTKNELPSVTYQEALSRQDSVAEILATTTPVLFFYDRGWVVSQNDFSRMLEFQKNNGLISVGLNRVLFITWLTEKIDPEINIDPKDAKIEMQDGRVISFVLHQDGRKVDEEKTYELVNAGLADETREFALAVEIQKPNISAGDINDMGIQEIIGTGHSNFSGSPNNRRYNIKNGASKLKGILIKPDEEFSLITTLGPVDGETGYLPELVIKDNKTIPEFGGGLCQIGTTVFRAAMASGLPITERRNHSYSVTYYLENGLPGTDATIYIPHPDVRFINDTGHYILVQPRIEGNDLYFDFWGTKDGRVAERTTPKVWGWVSPAPTKYIETLDLKPGVKKCTEAAHKGVNASFDYTITYASGEVKKQTFTSHYKPWQAVCLIGVEQLSEPAATSTEAIVPLNP